MAASGLSDVTEFDIGLSQRTSKLCEQLFLNKHGYALPPGRSMVGTQAEPIHSGSHNMPPDPKDFSLLPVRRIKLEDASVDAESNDSEMSIHTIYLKIRAFLYTAVFVNMDQPEWFDLAAAEALIDRLMNFLHHRHSAGRPPISLYTYACKSTARAFQLGIRSAKTLKELASCWTQYVPDTSKAERARAEKSPQRGGSRKGGGKEGGKDRARDEGGMPQERISEYIPEQFVDPGLVGMHQEQSSERIPEHNFRVASIEVMDSSDSDTEVVPDHCSVFDSPQFSAASPVSCSMFNTPEFATASPESCPLVDTPVFSTSSPGSCPLYDVTEFPTTPSREVDAAIGTSRRHRMEVLGTSSSDASLCESRSPSPVTTISYEDDFPPVVLPFCQDIPDLES